MEIFIGKFKQLNLAIVYATNIKIKKIKLIKKYTKMVNIKGFYSNISRTNSKSGEGEFVSLKKKEIY